MDNNIIPDGIKETRIMVKLPDGFEQTSQSAVKVGQERARIGRVRAFAVPGVDENQAMELVASDLQRNAGLSSNDIQMEPDRIQIAYSQLVDPITKTTFNLPDWLMWIIGKYKMPAPLPDPDPVKDEDGIIDVSPSLYHLLQSGFQTAWAAGYTGKRVILGVNDTGCGPSSCITPMSNLNTVGFREPNYEDDNDINGHGTHVAGIVASRSGCDNGIVGCAPGAQLKIYKSGQGSFRSSDIIQAIDAAQRANVKVLNNSWGGGYSQFMQDKFTEALNAGMICVKAVGNENIECPDPYHDVLMVSAINQWNGRSTYSNSVSSKFVPYTIACYGDDILSHLPNNRTGYMSGTSMASPIATAAMGLWCEKTMGTPAREQFETFLITCVTDAPSIYGRGRLNLAGVTW